MYFSSIHKDVQRRGVYMEEQTKYFVLKQKAVPEVLLKVVEAKKLIESERAITIQEATEKDVYKRQVYRVANLGRVV